MSSAVKSADPVHAVKLPPAIPDVPTYRFTAVQYHQLVDAGILDEDAQVELLEGWIVPKMTKNPSHDSALRNLLHLLQGLLTSKWDIHSQSVLAIRPSEPEPDLRIVPHDPNIYADRHPTPRDARLVIEVAERSLSRDRSKKQKIYAAAGIPEYWIVNLIDRIIEVCTEPTSSGHGRRANYSVEKGVPLNLAGKRIGEIAVGNVLP